MNIKTLFAAYVRQQKQLQLPDVVFGDVSVCRVFSVKKPGAVPVKARPSVRQESAEAPAIKTVKKTVAPAAATENGQSVTDSRNKLASLRKIDRSEIAPRVRRSAAAQPAAAAGAALSFEQKRDALKKLFFSGCSLCHLAQSRKKMVFGSGNVDAPVVIVGEAPGEEEDRQGIPFVGPAGQLLTQMLAAVKLDRAKDTFITNVLKCHPPANRNPESAEIVTCFPLLKKQIEIIHPKAILLLGRIAAHAVLGNAGSISSMRSKVFTYNTIPCMVIYHPAALLHNVAYKRPAWEDLKKFKELLDSLGVYGSLQQQQK
ncbi:MAG: uracil-DNA glycosylase [Chitinispirillaceae bacterium]|nr:uracil-DNA glycosylase [Chitinispirillaceae bacterium]